MKKQDYQLTIPAEIGEHFQLKDQDSAKLVVKRGRLVVQFEDSRLSIFQKRVWVWPVMMAILASVGYYVYCLTQHIKYVQLSGDNSLATAIILIGVVMGIILFAGFFIQDRKSVV